MVCLTEDTKRGNSFVRREIGYALLKKKPIYVARFHNTDPHLALVNHTYLDFFPPPSDQHLATLCEWLGRPDDAIPAATTDPFRPYLDTLYQFVVNFLKSAVIRHIELDLSDRPDQVPQARPRAHNALQAQVMPWMQPGTPEPPQLEAFGNFREAFRAYGERVVLLGEPGAGKTITLLNQLRESITARLDDPTKPLPLFAFITSWDSQKRQPFPLWLHEQQPLLSAGEIGTLLAKGEAVLFLDGLDELGAEREEKVEDAEGKKEIRRYDPRRRFIDSFSEMISGNRALVACRVRDYAEIGQQIPLNGAVQLNPLNDAQIREYLAELPELLAAVEADDNLQEMLRTPLLMSLFAFAFRDELTSEQRDKLRDMAHTDADELRDQIIRLYLERRYYWEASKGLPMPYSYDEWIEKLQIIAYRGVDTFANYYGNRDQYKGVDELNILRRHNIALDLPEKNVASFLAFSQALNVILRIEDNTYRFQHLLLLGALAAPIALERLKNKGQEAANACGVLGTLRVKRAIDPLIHALEDADKRVRSRAATALGEIGDARAVAPLIHALSDANWNVQREVAEALAKIGERAVAFLIHALGDVEWKVRSGVAEQLGKLGHAQGVDPLIHTLSDADWRVRRSAAAALGEIGDAQAVEPLIHALMDESDSDRVRSCAAEALGKISDARAVEPLKRLLDDTVRSYFGGRRRVCDFAAIALEQIGTPEAKAALENWLAAGNEIIRS
ncbi:NACHT domain-containing protein [bacterium]|nr:NACHT domain-containing protein [bacterium]